MLDDYDKKEDNDRILRFGGVNMSSKRNSFLILKQEHQNT